MNNEPIIWVLCGAISPEREVSLRSASACVAALRTPIEETIGFQMLDKNELPPHLKPGRDIIFPVIHGDYGEDGGIQSEMEAGGFIFAGCDANASRLCIDKVKTKSALRAAGIPVTAEVSFSAEKKPAAAEIFSILKTDDIVIKPADKGSSVGLHLVKGEAEVSFALEKIDDGNWLAEPRLSGREMTIGLLDGEPLGIVEIVPGTGAYDYQNKYTAGATEYLFPAAVPFEVAEKISAAARQAFQVCGCRDFCRMDFILQNDTDFNFLEINTMPGMTETSLFPKSASCLGIDFHTLVRRMIAPAIQRFHARS